MLDEVKNAMKVLFGISKVAQDKTKINGTVLIETINEDGIVTQTTIVPSNQVTLIGDAYVADQLSDQGEGAMTHMAVGTTSGGKTEASTTLEAENTRNALTSGPTQGAGADDHKVEYAGTFTGIDATLVEAGIFNAAGAGVMLCYSEFSHTMEASGTLQITWTLSVSH